MKGSAGYWGGWREFRYGGRASPVHVPGKTRPAQKGRERMVREVRELLLTFTATPFEHEGACRHGVRSGLCLEGNDWQTADDVAGYVVAEGLRSIGAKRPTWEQGQREYVIPEECCAWCGRDIEQIGLRQDRYCSPECARAAWQWRVDEEGTKLSKMHRQAKRIIVREQQPERKCKCCGTAFRPSDPSRPSDFCSMACAKTIIPDRECAHCGTVFHPVNDKVICCSIACRSAHAKAPAKTLECQCCGRAFVASRAMRAAYCSESCRTMHRNFKTGRYIPKRVSPIAFDFFITVPVNSRPPWITAERFDELIAA